MAINIQEMRDSRRVVLAKDRESAVLEYVGYGTDDDAEARAAFRATIPATFTPFDNALVLIDFDCHTLGGKFWRATANYAPDHAPAFPAVGGAGPPTAVAAAPGLNTPLGPDYAFDFTGVTERITQSKETISKTKRGGGVAPDTKGAIGVTADGSVEGAERLRPNLEWSRTVTFNSITLAYIQTVSAMVGNANDAGFYNRESGSVIFMGGNAQIDDSFKAKVTFKFLNVDNKENIVICSDLTVPAKKGSEYLWVAYKSVNDANKLTQQPDAAYVEKIVDLVDFSQLRIGV